MIPLTLRLRKAQHKEIARAQDMIVAELYRQFDTAVIHGGTAIWRCYGGNRFSEDIDVYIQRDIKRADRLFSNLAQKGFTLTKKRITKNSIYSSLAINRITVRLEALFKRLPGSLKEYETADSNFITVYTLTPEELIREKVGAYLDRHKVRDLYDVFFLLRHVKKKEEIVEHLQKLIRGFKEPVDEEELKVLIIEGLVPEPENMLDYIKRWVA